MELLSPAVNLIKRNMWATLRHLKSSTKLESEITSTIVLDHRLLISQSDVSTTMTEVKRILSNIMVDHFITVKHPYVSEEVDLVAKEWLMYVIYYIMKRQLPVSCVLVMTGNLW